MGELGGHLVIEAQVAGGDRLGKTIVFAKNQDHAQFISERFDANYPQYRGEFARVITNRTEQAQDLIDKFSIADRAPHIALSVDMLDTGIAVPEGRIVEDAADAAAWIGLAYERRWTGVGGLGALLPVTA